MLKKNYNIIKTIRVYLCTIPSTYSHIVKNL